MTPALLIFLFTLVVFICALAIARRPRQQERTDDLYLDAPVWQGARAETKPAGADAHEDASSHDAPAEMSRAHLVAAAAKIEPPKGARLRKSAAESTRRADAAEQQTRLFDEVVSGLQRIPPL